MPVGVFRTASRESCHITFYSASKYTLNMVLGENGVGVTFAIITRLLL